MKYTTRLNLRKPEGTDPVKIEDINANMDKIDESLAGYPGFIIAPRRRSKQRTCGFSLNRRP